MANQKKAPETSRWQLSGDGVRLISNPNTPKAAKMKQSVRKPKGKK